MADSILQNQKVWLGPYDLTGHMNQVALESGADALDGTRLGDTTRRNVPGLKSVAGQVEGIWDVTPDGDLSSNLGVTDVPFTVAPLTGADGEVAQFFRAVQGDYNPFEGGQQGELLRFSAGAVGRGEPLVSGTILGQKTYTSTENGTGRQVGAAVAGQKIHAALHVFSASGTRPTLNVTIESDNSDRFRTPVTRFTFSQLAVAGSQYLTLAGPVSDDYWRIVATLGGTTPRFAAAIVLGVL